MIVRGTVKELLHRKEGDLLVEGGHHLCVYDSLKSFSEIYSKQGAASLRQNEVLLIATHYESIEKVKQNLYANGIDVQKHMSDGSLLIIDAQHGYFGPDVMGTYKMALSVIERAKKEKRRGLTWFGALDSFYAFQCIPQMLDYELSFGPKWDTNFLKTICSHHAANFEQLSAEEKQRLYDTHVRSIITQKDHEH